MGDQTAAPSNGTRPHPVGKRGRGGPRSVHPNQLTSFRLGNTRPIWVHVPSRTTEGGWPVAVLLDGERWAAAPFASVLYGLLDELFDDDEGAPFLAVLVGALDEQTSSVEQSGSERFVRFLTHELLPWVEAQWQTTTDPQRTVVVGCGPSGPAATFAVDVAPERFGHAVALSDASGLGDALAVIVGGWR